MTINVMQYDDGNLVANMITFLAQLRSEGATFTEQFGYANYVGSDPSAYITLGGNDLVFSNGALVGGEVTSLSRVVDDSTSVGTVWGIEDFSLSATETMNLLRGRPSALLDQLQNNSLNYYGGADGPVDFLGGGLNDVIYGSNGSDTLYGGAGNDLVLGSSGVDEVYGGIGNDKIIGGEDADRLSGGAGADTFSFEELSESTPGSSGRDVILDFSRLQGDKIEMSLFEFQPEFTFIGKSAYSGTAGELRYGISNGVTTISADIDGDASADFRVTLNRIISLQESDFLL